MSISIRFEIDGFADALVLPDKHGLSDDEIEKMKQQRFADWKEFVEIASKDDAQEVFAAMELDKQKAAQDAEVSPEKK
jgi:hypothetical protein